MIFTLLNLMLVIGCLFYMLNIESMRTRSIKESIKYQLGENEYEKHREYLLTRLKTYIVNNLSDNDEDGLHELLTHTENRNIKYEKSYIEYDKEEKKILAFINPSTHKTYRKEYYKVELCRDDKKVIRFKYLKTD